MSRRLAVVTGGSTGIGRAIVLALARDGWDVCFSYLHCEADAEAVESLVTDLDGDVTAVRCDAGVRQEVDAFYEAAARWRGAPDLLVNNAGVQTWCSLLELREEDWDRVIRTNLKGCFLNTQNAARRMRDAGKGGSIVNLGSGCNKFAFPLLVDYTASKGGVEQFTKVAAVELGPLGIRVNCVAPGAILNERTQAETEGYASAWARITPLRRVGEGEDVANAVRFLASGQSSFISGQTIWVDGGVFSQACWPDATGAGQ